MRWPVELLRETAWLVGVFGVSYLAFLLFALSQRRHWQAVTGEDVHPLHAVLRLRGTGLICLIAGLVMAVIRDGFDYGVILWALLLTLAAIGAVSTLAFAPSRMRFLARALRCSNR